ncbi:MAG: hypothetical protein HFE83_05925 [Lachnospiraceae bacterium]|nr:hypothetical protein [Lachnospiraceae bacterium]
MRIEDHIAALEDENRRLRDDNEKLLNIITQMKVTLDRLVNYYITDRR